MFRDICNRHSMTIKVHKGVSLIEMIVAIFFFATIALGLAYSLSGSAFLTAKNQEVITANNLAKLYLNNLNMYWAKQVDFDNNNTLPSVETAEYTNEGNFTVKILPNGEVITYTDPQTNIVTIKRVTIAYYDKKSGRKLLQLTKEYNRPYDPTIIK